MILTDAEKHQLIHAMSTFMQNGPAELRLYGSHAEDQLVFAGIHLLIVTDATDYADGLTSLKKVIQNALKKQFPDQTIELKIAAKEEINQDPFLKNILPKSILLYRFGV